MKYGSVCSGVEAATLAWKPLGWNPVFFSEIEPFPCAVLHERYNATRPINDWNPDEAETDEEKKMRIAWNNQNRKLPESGDVPNEGDFTKIGNKYNGKIDLLVGGTPCQDLSVAGRRAGFDGKRSCLAIDFVRLAYESQCRWFVWENVPGVFSSNGGGDFATFLSLLCGREIGIPKDGFATAGFVCNDRRDRYGLAWRVLDAQFTRVSGFPFAIPQRRRRVFVVGYFGDWRRAAEVLLEPDCMSWNTPARVKTRELIAGHSAKSIGTASREFQITNGMGAKSNVSCTLDVKCKDGAITETKGPSGTITENEDSIGNECHLVMTSTNLLKTVYGLKSAQTHEIKSIGENIAQPLSLNNSGYHYICDINTVADRQEYSIFRWHNQDATAYELYDEVSLTISAGMGQGGAVQTSPILLVENGKAEYMCYENHANDSRVTELKDGTFPSITTRAGTGGNNLPLVQVFCNAVAIAENIIGRQPHNGGNGVGAQEELAYTQNATGVMGVCANVSGFDGYICTVTGDVSKTVTCSATDFHHVPCVLMHSVVRRLLPVECERLMGFPDNYTKIPYNGKPADKCPDAPRYKACGNSMCVNVMRWIGEQIERVERKYKTTDGELK